MAAETKIANPIHDSFRSSRSSSISQANSEYDSPAPLTFKQRWDKLGRRYTVLAMLGFAIGAVLLGIFLHLIGKLGSAPKEFLGFSVGYVAPIMLPIGLILVALATVGHLLHVRLQYTKTYHKWQNIHGFWRIITGILLSACTLAVLIGWYGSEWPVMQAFFDISIKSGKLYEIFISVGAGLGIIILVGHALHIASQSVNLEYEKANVDESLVSKSDDLPGVPIEHSHETSNSVMTAGPFLSSSTVVTERVKKEANKLANEFKKKKKRKTPAAETTQAPITTTTILAASATTNLAQTASGLSSVSSVSEAVSNPSTINPVENRAIAIDGSTAATATAAVVPATIMPSTPAAVVTGSSAVASLPGSVSPTSANQLVRSRSKATEQKANFSKSALLAGTTDDATIANTLIKFFADGGRETAIFTEAFALLKHENNQGSVIQLAGDQYGPRARSALVLLKNEKFLQLASNTGVGKGKIYDGCMAEVLEYLSAFYKQINRVPAPKSNTGIGDYLRQVATISREDLQALYLELKKLQDAGVDGVTCREPYFEYELGASTTVHNPSISTASLASMMPQAATTLSNSASVPTVSGSTKSTLALLAHQTTSISSPISGTANATAMASSAPSPVSSAAPLLKSQSFVQTNSSSAPSSSPESSPTAAITASSGFSFVPPLSRSPSTVTGVDAKSEAQTIGNRIADLFDSSSLRERQKQFLILFDQLKQHVKNQGLSVALSLLKGGKFKQLLIAPIHSTCMEIGRIKNYLKDLNNEAVERHKSYERNSPPKTPMAASLLGISYNPAEADIQALYDQLTAINQQMSTNKITGLTYPGLVRSRSNSETVSVSSMERKMPVGAVRLPIATAVHGAGSFGPNGSRLPETPIQKAKRELKEIDAEFGIVKQEVVKQSQILDDAINLTKQNAILLKDMKIEPDKKATMRAATIDITVKASQAKIIIKEQIKIAEKLLRKMQAIILPQEMNSIDRQDMRNVIDVTKSQIEKMEPARSKRKDDLDEAEKRLPKKLQNDIKDAKNKEKNKANQVKKISYTQVAQARIG